MKDRFTIEVNVHKNQHDYVYAEIKKILQLPPFTGLLEGDDYID